jgi:hypothetical protein
LHDRHQSKEVDLFRSTIHFYKELIFHCTVFIVLLCGVNDVRAGTLHLAWIDTSENEEGFQIERLVGGLIDRTISIGPNTTSYIDTGLTKGVTYCYRVRAFNSAGESLASEQPCSIAQDTVLSANASTMQPGGTITATWSGVPGATATDWIGLYLQNAADNDLLAWIYVSCSQSADSTRASGSCSFNLPASMSSGIYELRLFFKDGFTRLATSDALSVGTAVTSVAALTANPTTAYLGSAVQASWSEIAGPSPTDWIGLYLSGASDSNLIDWTYVSCSKAVGSAKASGTCPFGVPLTANSGTYELRLFSNDSFRRIAVSNIFTVTKAVSSPILPVAPSGLQVGFGL